MPRRLQARPVSARPYVRVLFGAALASALGACSSGVGTSTLPPHAAPVVPDAAARAAAAPVSAEPAAQPDAVDWTAADAAIVPDTTTVSTPVVVKIPASASSTKSLSIAVNGDSATIANVGTGLSGCAAATSSTPLTCTVAVSAPVGSDRFTIKTYNATSATGTLLASGTIVATVASTAPKVPVTLGGTIAALAVTLSNSAPRECSTASTSAYVTARTSAGDALIVPSYNVAIALADSDTSGATKLSTTSITSSSTIPSVSYNGNKIGTATITATASGATSASAVLSPAQMLYVWDAGAQQVDVWPATATGNVKPARIVKPATGEVSSSARQIVVDKTCKLYIADGQGSDGVFVFPAGANGTVAPTAAIYGSNTPWTVSTGGPQGVTVDSKGYIYAPMGSGGVGIWAPGSNGNVAPTKTLSPGNNKITASDYLAIDGSDKLYVLGFRDVYVYAAGATGSAAPLRTVTFNGLYCVNGMTVDAKGDIFVADCGGVVEEFGPTATGAATPIRTFNEGSGTGLQGAALDRSGNFYNLQGSMSGNAVSFAATASGNASPRTNISGSNTTIYEAVQLTL